MEAKEDEMTITASSIPHSNSSVPTADTWPWMGPNALASECPSRVDHSTENRTRNLAPTSSNILWLTDIDQNEVLSLFYEYHSLLRRRIEQDILDAAAELDEDSGMTPAADPARLSSVYIAEIMMPSLRRVKGIKIAASISGDGGAIVVLDNRQNRRRISFNVGCDGRDMVVFLLGAGFPPRKDSIQVGKTPVEEYVRWLIQ